MKITTKLIMLGLVGVAAAPFILKKEDGTPWLTLSDVKKAAESSASKAIPSEPKQMYRWQDKAGNWHYSDKPSSQYQSQEVQLDTAYNQMKQINLPEGFGETKKSTDGRFDPTEGGSSFPLTTAPLEKVPDMMKEIERVQDKLDQRQKAMENY